jgi:molybdenum cofactor synthesis domain-containing protein
MSLRFGILTISDRSARGEMADLSGPALQAQVERAGWQVAKSAVIPDDYDTICDILIAWSDGGMLDVLLTTGGTGFAPRDVTPEATQAVVERLAPGLAEVMRIESRKVTAHAMLSRAVAGIRGQTVIVNLPGSPRGAIENLAVIQAVLPHAVELLHNDPKAERGH